jgi:hypothetical protein
VKEWMIRRGGISIDYEIITAAATGCQALQAIW